jgi:hypothetical protein
MKVERMVGEVVPLLEWSNSLRAGNCNLFPSRATSPPLRNTHHSICCPFQAGNRRQDARICFPCSLP